MVPQPTSFSMKRDLALPLPGSPDRVPPRARAASKMAATAAEAHDLAQLRGCPGSQDHPRQDRRQDRGIIGISEAVAFLEKNLFFTNNICKLFQ
jgi:hypothetical protein